MEEKNCGKELLAFPRRHISEGGELCASSEEERKFAAVNVDQVGDYSTRLEQHYRNKC